MQNLGNKRGKLFLVGAGPGNPDLLTLQAYKLISTATTVVYDRLVSKEIMDMIPDDAEKIYVGKAPGKHHLNQDEINKLLIKLADTGKDIIRLKGGDPFIFGRGGEEAIILNEHGIDVEIVPGITTAQGVSAHLKLPLTHRGLSTGVRYLTGCCAGELKSELDWKGLADGETTLVIYMGLTNIAEIAEKLLGEGMSADMPAAIIQNATRENQRFVTTTLEKLSDAATQYQFAPPTLFIIGHVVSVAEQLGDQSYGQNDNDIVVNG